MRIKNQIKHIRVLEVKEVKKVYLKIVRN